MMTRTQAILGKIAEECNEVAQRALKAQKFGLLEMQPGQGLNNLERILDEYLDLRVAMQKLDEDVDSVDMFEAEDKIFKFGKEQEALTARSERFEKYINLGVEKGMISKDAIKS